MTAAATGFPRSGASQQKARIPVDYSLDAAAGLPACIELFNGRSGQSDLMRYEAVRGTLAEACKIDEVKDIRDKAEAMAAYARQAKNTELIQLATEIKVRAERRCGELLASTEMQHGGHAMRARSNDATELVPLKLAQMGLTKDDSSRYQKLAAMPASLFEEALVRTKATIGQVTTAQLLREARKASGPKKTAQDEPNKAAVADAACSAPVPSVMDDSAFALAPPPADGAAYRALQLRYDELEDAHRQLGRRLAQTEARLDAKCQEYDNLRGELERSQASVCSSCLEQVQQDAEPFESGSRVGPQALPVYDIDADAEPWLPAFSLVLPDSAAAGSAPPLVAEPGQRRCADCRHHLPRGTCGQPEAAGLIEMGRGFGIAWPERGQAASCSAFSSKEPKPIDAHVGGTASAAAVQAANNIDRLEW